MKRFFLHLALMGLALALVACGGGQPDSISLNFEGNDDLRFVPEGATVTDSSKVEVTLKNVSAIDHTWTLVASDTDPARVSESDAIAGISTGIVSGGDSKTIGFTAPAPGTYQFVCLVPGHAAAGMVGALSVDQ